jgi:ABC-type cobalamin/Fe3+-siderophores transport system ATPase subunit
MTFQQQKPITPKPLPAIAEYGPYAIEVKDLTFGYNGSSSVVEDDTKNVLHNLNLTLTTGSRCLLIGANGSGKSTLLRILAGRHLTQQEVKVLGLNSFRDSRLNFHRAVRPSSEKKNKTDFFFFSVVNEMKSNDDFYLPFFLLFFSINVVP